ncbi:hypothetical protein [Sediminibacterium salmoneum]|uniref:hypothetical protein n=1 Tax=Sediminibacterium salmoneum TaxID=426421 RepID=UPI0004B19A9C|nr:hypothetical protein [Sediminibacterium salmoneum]
MKKILSILFLIIMMAFTSLGRQNNSTEMLDWNSIRINNKLPLVCKKLDLIKLLGNPDKIINPEYLDICASYFEKDFNYLVWGDCKFESTNSQAVISSVDIESGIIKLVSPLITLDNSVTFEKIKRVFPNSAKYAKELIVEKKGTVLSIKLASSRKNSDDGWLLFFKAGKLVRVDYWIAC